MRSRIQRSMILVLCITLAISYLLLTVAVYNQTFQNLQAEVEQEARYIKEAIDISGTDYLEAMDNVQQNTRVTVITPEGNVVYDTKDDELTLANHKNRIEVKAALLHGEGRDVRVSDTIKERSIYYALLLKDGNVLRVSRTVDNVLPMFIQVLPYITIIAVVMICFAIILARWQTSRLIRPINELDLNEPLKNEIYEEFKPLLERIDKQNKEKDAAAQMRKEFSANVSHELKTPLTSISGYAEIMKSGLVKPEDMPKFSERIYDEACRLITLVEDIIKLSKLDEERVEIEKEDVDLYELAMDVCSRLSLPAERKGVQIKVHGESVICHGVRPVLQEMIYNICANGIKYNKDGGKLDVWVGNTLSGKKVIVRDSGIGIPKEDLDRIFERFYRVDKSHSKQSGGTGLGLSIVKHGAMLHQAEVHVESELGKGTKMELIFKNDLSS
mgnify:FL=1